MGTGSDPTSANNRNVEAWTLAGEKWTALNLISQEWGIQMYTHNHDPAYNFLADGPMVTATQDRFTGATVAPYQVRAESGKRLMQHYLDVTDPDLVVVEMDIYWAHVAQHKHRWRFDETGQRVEDIFDPLATVAKQTHRYPLYHAKDGDRTLDAPGIGNGYTMVPFGDPPPTSTTGTSSEPGRQGVAQPQLRAGQRSRGQCRPGAVPSVHRHQRGEHERAPGVDHRGGTFILGEAPGTARSRGPNLSVAGRAPVRRPGAHLPSKPGER